MMPSIKILAGSFGNQNYFWKSLLFQVQSVF